MAATLEPTITLGAVGIIVSVVGSIGAATWFIIQATSGIHKIFSTLGSKIDVMREKLDSQGKRLDHIDNELKTQTEIMTEQRIQEERMNYMEKRLDNWENRTQRLIEEMGRREVGAKVGQAR